MTVAYTSQKTIGSKDIPPSRSFSLTSPSNTYTRPSDWLTLPTISTSDQKFVGLHAVHDNASNYVALSATVPTGSFQVDWGDGTAPQTYATGATAQYNYTYSTISNSTISTRGYKQVIVTVTPVGAGLLTVVDLNKKFINVPALPAYTAKWLDIAVGSPNLTTYTIAGSSPVISFSLLEQASIIKTAANSTGFFNYMFMTLPALKSVPVLAGPDNWNAANGMFASCFSLVYLPSLPPTSASSFGGSTMFQNCYSLSQFPTIPTQCDSGTNMFAQCYNMAIAPAITFRNASSLALAYNTCTKLVDASQIKILNLGGSTSFNSFFNGCSSLVNAPYLDTINANDMSSMFSGCVSLKSVPLYNTKTNATFTSMFSGCRALETVPLFDMVYTSNVVTITNMFLNCTSLTKIPNFNFSKVNAAVTTFSGCISLKTVPDLNLENVNFLTGFLSGCTSLETVGNLTTTKNSGLDSTFSNCVNLKVAPTMDTANVTTFISAFNGCTALTSVPLYNTSNSVNFNSMFASTQNLSTIPAFDMSKATQATSMFNTSKIITVPDLNTANMTNFTNMFNGCTSLIKAPGLDTSKATNITTLFTTCPALISIPTYNCSNVTTSPAAFTSGAVSLSAVGITGLKLTHSYATNLLNKDALETICANLGVAATTQTLTISSNPGADTAVTVSAATISINSVDASSTTGVLVGMYAYGNGTNSLTANFLSSTSEFQVPSFNAIEPGDGIMFGFTAFTVNPGLTVNQTYYSVNSRSGGYFKLSLTPGGAPITLTASSSGTITYANYVTAVSTNNVTLKLPGTSGSGLSVQFRKLNTHAARIKNWTVTG